MPKCCGVESEKIVYPRGSIGYHCPVCGCEYTMAPGLEFLSGYKTIIRDAE